MNSQMQQNEQPISYKNQERVFQKLKQITGNQKCADCNFKNPVWTSLTFGVFLCLECAGGHRFLPQDVSNKTSVKSINLDSWKPSNLQKMEKIGNFLANSFFEKKLDPSQKPGPQSSIDDKYNYIKNKYINQHFISLLVEEDDQTQFNQNPVITYEQDFEKFKTISQYLNNKTQVQEKNTCQVEKNNQETKNQNNDMKKQNRFKFIKKQQKQEKQTEQQQGQGNQGQQQIQSQETKEIQQQPKNKNLFKLMKVKQQQIKEKQINSSQAGSNNNNADLNSPKEIEHNISTNDSINSQEQRFQEQPVMNIQENQCVNQDNFEKYQRQEQSQYANNNNNIMNLYTNCNIGNQQYGGYKTNQQLNFHQNQQNPLHKKYEVFYQQESHNSSSQQQYQSTTILKPLPNKEQEKQIIMDKAFNFL